MYDLTLRATGADPLLNLALEESLLERGFEGDSLLLLYVDRPCVVIGRNQNPWIEASGDAGLPLLRRVSGGGAVYHDSGNLNWSLIVPRSRHDKEGELASISRALRAIGVETESGPRGGLFLASAGPWKGAKLSGSARRLTASRVLHHGTLLVDADLDRLSSSLRGLEAVETRALPSVRSRSVNLSSLVPGLGLDDVASCLARELTGREASAAEGVADAAFADAAARRLADWEWTWGATPPFSIALRWRGGEAVLEVRAGLVNGVSGPGSEALAGLVGSRFDYDVPAAAAAAMEGADAPPA
jgi:lipoate-protein ligase A